MLFLFKKNISLTLVIGTLLSFSQPIVAHHPKKEEQEASTYEQLKNAAHWGLALGASAAVLYVASHYKTPINADQKTKYEKAIISWGHKLVAIPKWVDDHKHAVAIATPVAPIIKYGLKGSFNGFVKGLGYHIIKQASIPNAWFGIPADKPEKAPAEKVSQVTLSEAQLDALAAKIAKK
jgi:hypothetical protein